MTTRQGGATARRGPRLRRALLLVLLFVLPAAAEAQVRPDTAAPDTASRDTLLVPIPPTGVSPDTLPSDSMRADSAETVVPPPFPRYPSPLPTGWAAARWEWDRAALWRFQGMTLLEFLERTPGLMIVRAGDRGYPVGVTTHGLGGGRLRVYMDGFEVDPLGYTSLDVQQLGMIELESVRIERDLTGVRIELSTIPRPQNRPFSAVEAATGTYESKLLRGVLVRGIGGRSTITASYDAMTTEGFRYEAPFAVVAARAAWSYAVSERTGLQVELRNGGVERLGGGFDENYDRRTVLLRARSQLRDGLVVDAALGRAWRRPATRDFLAADLSSTQGLLRASYTLPRGWAEGSIRLRDDQLVSSAAPRVELATRGAFRPLPWVGAEAEVRTGRVGDAGGLVWQATGRAGRPGTPTVFASVAGGSQGVGLVADEDSVPRFSSVSSGVGAARLGAEIARAALTVGVAAVGLTAGRVAPFGVAFDRGLAAIEAGAAQGVETHLSALLPRTGELVRVDGSLNYWGARGDRPYLPTHDARAALTAHGLFYSGQLEPTLSFRVHRRGAMRVPTAPDGVMVETTAYTLTNLFIQIRIQDVQAFGLWENFLNYRSAADVPGALLPGQRLVYGIRWVFRD